MNITDEYVSSRHVLGSGDGVDHSKPARGMSGQADQERDTHDNLQTCWQRPGHERRTRRGAGPVRQLRDRGAPTPRVAATWTVKPGGAITAKAGKTTLTDKSTDSVLTCTSSSGKGTVKKGSGLSGTGIGSITALSFSNCTGPLGLTFTVHTTHFPWHLNAKTFSGGVTTGTITGIHATLSGPSCSPRWTAPARPPTTAGHGQVQQQHRQAEHDRRRQPARLQRPAGCAGLINNGDAVSFVGSYAVSPKQTITSP